VPGCINEVEVINLTVLRAEIETHALSLDRNATLPFKVHGVENLMLHFAIGEATTQLDEPVGQRRLAVINVGDDGKVSDVFHTGDSANVSEAQCYAEKCCLEPWSGWPNAATTSATSILPHINS